MGIKISIRQMVKLHLKSPSLLECFYAKYFTMFAWKSKGEGRVDYDEDKIIFWFRKSVERLCVSWALPFIECVAVWALKLPVPHTDVLKTHEPQNFSAGITRSQRNWQQTFDLNQPSSLSLCQ